MAVITTGAAAKTLWPGIMAWWGTNYEEHDKIYPQLFEIKSGNKAYEETPELRGFGLAPEKPEGTSVQYDTWDQGPVTRYTQVAYALGFIVTHEAAMDNLYEETAMQRTQQLAFSARTTKEIVHHNVYNRAFNSNFLGADGVELLSLLHPTLSGTQQNELTVAADLSETALEDLAILVADAKNSRGLPVAFRPKRLIVNTAEQFNAERILGSVLQNDSANNAVNALRSMGTVSDGYIASTYLDDPDAWFLRTDAPLGMCSIQREEVQFTQDNDFDTDNYKYKFYERYVPGFSDWRGLYGSAGS